MTGGEAEALAAAKREPPAGSRGFERTTQTGLLAALNYERGVEAGWKAHREYIERTKDEDR